MHQSILHGCFLQMPLTSLIRWKPVCLCTSLSLSPDRLPPLHMVRSPDGVYLIWKPSFVVTRLHSSLSLYVKPFPAALERTKGPCITLSFIFLPVSALPKYLKLLVCLCLSSRTCPTSPKGRMTSFLVSGLLRCLAQ